jgi:hypothetical protein
MEYVVVSGRAIQVYMSVACSLVCGQEGRFFSLGGREERGGCVAGTICLGLFVPSPHGCMRAGRWVLSSLMAADVGRCAAWCLRVSRY